MVPYENWHVCMLQNKVCLEHTLKMAPSSIQALLYTSLQLAKTSGKGSNLPPYRVFESVNCSRFIAVYTAPQ
jgi:hypothetical protein